MNNNKRCNRHSIVLWIVLCLSFFTGCSATHDSYSCKTSHWLTNPQPMRVLCTTEMIEALVQDIGKDLIQTLPLVYGELDPHSYQIVKGDDEKIAKALVIFGNGLGLEHSPSLRAALERHPKVFLLGDILRMQQPEQIILHADVADPHIWLDVKLFSQLCPIIAEKLSQLDSGHASLYRERAQALQARLLELHDKLKALYEAVDESKRYLVTSHEAFYYLARAYLAPRNNNVLEQWKGRFCAPEGLAPESQISLHRIEQIVDYVLKHQIQSAFMEVNVNTDAIFKIQEVLKAKGYTLSVPPHLLYSDSMPEAKVDHEHHCHEQALDRYIRMMEHNTQTIVGAWDGH